MKILFIGDIFGKPGRLAVAELLPGIVRDKKPDFVIGNCENIAHGSGITSKTINFLFDSGFDILTSGNHVFDNRKSSEVFNEFSDRILRPANYPPGIIGTGHTILVRNKFRLGVINLHGRVFIVENFDCPFRKANEILKEFDNNLDGIIVDFHAEATSEKIAFAWNVDGRVSAVLGTHTHVQTADNRILKEGTGFISDVGMTGPHDSIIGLEIQSTMQKFLFQTPIRFEPAKDNLHLQGVFIEIENFLTKTIERVDITLD